MVYRDIRMTKPDGKTDCPIEPQTKTMVLSNGRLLFDGLRYQRATQLEPSVKQTFAGFIANPPKLDCEMSFPSN